MIQIAYEIPKKQKSQKEPAQPKHYRAFDSLFWLFEDGDIHFFGDAFAKIEIEYHDRGENTQKIWPKHMLGIFPKADMKIVCGEDVGQIGDDQGIGGAVAYESPGHDECKEYLVIQSQELHF